MHQLLKHIVTEVQYLTLHLHPLYLPNRMCVRIAQRWSNIMKLRNFIVTVEMNTLIQNLRYKITLFSKYLRCAIYAHLKYCLIIKLT